MLITEHQKHWWNKYKALMRGMPAGLELNVRHGSTSVCEAGARRKHLDATGDADNVPEIDSVPTPRVYPNSESL